MGGILTLCGSDLANKGISKSNVDHFISEDMGERIGKALVLALVDLPEAFAWERRNILWEMWYRHPKPYIDETFGDSLKWSEYPTNDAQVCELAMKVATGDALKQMLTQIVHGMFDEEIKNKLGELNDEYRESARKEAESIIQRAIELAVDNSVVEIRNKLKGGSDFSSPITFSQGEPKPGPNPVFERMKFSIK